MIECPKQADWAIILLLTEILKFWSKLWVGSGELASYTVLDMAKGVGWISKPQWRLVLSIAILSTVDLRCWYRCDWLYPKLPPARYIKLFVFQW